MEEKEKAKKAIIRLLDKQANGVTFVALERALKVKEIPYEGDWGYVLDENQNVLLWKGSDVFITAVQELLAEGVMDMVASQDDSTIQCYVADGKAPQLPIAKPNQLMKYTTLHWLPVTFKRGKHFKQALEALEKEAE